MGNYVLDNSRILLLVLQQYRRFIVQQVSYNDVVWAREDMYR